MSGLLTRLNMNTRRWHADVDEPWLRLLRPTVSRAEYVRQLVRIYGLVAPFESACKYTPGHLDVRGRAGLIAQDLLALGLSAVQVATIPQCGSITTFKGTAEAAGWLYVVERATLLQTTIRSHLTARLPEVHDACSYLSAFDRADDHWPNVARQLDEIGACPVAAAEMVAAANTAFLTVKHWLVAQ